MTRLPTDAFEYYVSLGDQRSYQAVADHFGVTKRTVTNRAKREGWQERLEKIERAAREKSDARLVETIEAMNRRHTQMMQAVQRKGLEALKNYPIESAMDAVRALDMAVKHERVIRGEPSERTATQVEDIIQREYERWMSHEDKDSDQIGRDLEEGDADDAHSGDVS